MSQQLSRSRDNVSNKGLALSETEQLQQDIDDFTKLLEKEKRQLMITEDQIKQVNSEIAEKKIAIEKFKKADEKKPIRDKIERIKIQTDAHRIKNETLKFNVTKTKNKKLRDTIDMLRKELMSKQDECKRLYKMTDKARQLAEEQNSEAK